MDKAGNLFSAFIYFILLIVVSIISIENWKVGITSLSIATICYVIHKKMDLIIHLKYYVIALLIIATILHFTLLINMFLLILTTNLWFSIPLLIDVIKRINKDEIQEIFYMDAKNLRCLVLKDNNYKAFVSNPMAYLNHYTLPQLELIRYQNQELTFVINDLIVRPMSLNKEEKSQIFFFCQSHYPHLFNDLATNIYIQSEKKIETVKLITWMLSVFFFSFLIYYLGDNGRNGWVTGGLFLAMIALPPLIIKIITNKKR